MTLSGADFVAFFRSVHGIEPFEWQQRLVARVLHGGWPEVIDVPTGLGKTAVVDVAVFALAAQARLATDERTAPTRTFVVVNRRVIVDQTHERATLLQSKLDSPDSEILDEVALRLRELSVGAASKRSPMPPPLEVVRMRGGVSWSWRWLASPTQPAVVTGTVDQYGSRLLFRGYGVGDTLRPIDAALTGTDRLLILDEAHLSWPFIQTAKTVDAHEHRAETQVLPLRRPAPVLLSATPPLGEPRPREVFRFDPGAETSDVAQQRFTAQRQVRLVELKAAKQDTERDLADALAVLAERLVCGAARVAVVCNTVSLARGVFALLEKQLSERADVALLVGRCRGIDREHISKKWIRGRLSPDRRTDDERPLVAVATQTIEVGADVDLDALVTEAAPLDALLQRLGRLDRRGSRGPSQALVVHAPYRHDTQDGVYGEATVRTWTWLTDQAGSPKPATLAAIESAAQGGPSLQEGPSLEMGPMQLSALLDPAARSTLASEPPLAPVALSPTLDGWARTHPRPDPDQPVGPFLHGLDRGQAEVLVCWRAGLPEASDETLESWELELRTVPVGAHETVAIPIGEARRFLAGADVAGGTDIEGQDGAGTADVTGTGNQTVVAQAPDGAARLVRRPRDVMPGDVLVLDATAGGHDSWGWTGRWKDGRVADVGDMNQPRPRLRLRAEVIAGLLGAAPSDVAIPEPDDPEADLNRLLKGLRDLAGSAATPYAQDLARVCECIAPDPRETMIETNTPSSRWRLLTRPRAGVSLPAAVGDGDEGAGEVAASSSGSRPVDLDEHLCDVKKRASQFAQHLGLPIALVEAEALAGLAHDLGKVDPRFQAMLYGGDTLRAQATGRTLAKSGMDPTDRAAFQRARRRAGLPAGLRHEAQSAALLAVMLDTAPELGEGLDVELIHHLVASHHGHGRPLLPGVTDPTPVELRAQLPDTGVSASTASDSLLIDWTGPARFRRLGVRYGWWGLALLETILRLADIAVSEEYAEREDDE